MWHANKPRFLQADGITVALNQHVTGIDFTVPGNVQITPKINQTTFKTGDTLSVDLQVQNASPNPASVEVLVRVNISAEPGINPASFCCFQDPVGIFEAEHIPIDARADTVVPNFYSYHFTGGETPGSYGICITVVQNGVSSSRCATFTFAP